MRNPHNAVSDMLNTLEMGNTVCETVTQDQFNHHKWIIRLESNRNSLDRAFMDIEVIEEEDGDASVCLMRRHNVGRRALQRIMRTLVNVLDDSPHVPQFGEPNLRQ
jgi:hypothetical protein